MSGTGLAMAVQDWERIEDVPGHRAELFAGEVRMNPAPRLIHQHLVRLLTNALADACGPTHRAFFDIEWRIPAAGPGTLAHAPRPDILVAPASATRGQVAFSGQPLIVVEVLSPGNRKADLAEKQAIYFRHGAHAYVEVSISDDETEVVIIWSRRGPEAWEEIARAGGEQHLEIDDPFVVRLRPNALLA